MQRHLIGNCGTANYRERGLMDDFFLDELEKAKLDNLYKMTFRLGMIINAIVLVTIIYLAK